MAPGDQYDVSFNLQQSLMEEGADGILLVYAKTADGAKIDLTTNSNIELTLPPAILESEQVKGYHQITVMVGATNVRGRVVEATWVNHCTNEGRRYLLKINFKKDLCEQLQMLQRS